MYKNKRNIGVIILLFSVLSIVLFYQYSIISSGNNLIIEVKKYTYNLDSLQKTIFIGRDTENHISLINKKASGKHIQLNLQDSSFVLTNISDTKRVLYGNQYLSSVILKKGDIIEFHKIKYKVLEKPKISFLGGITLKLKNLNDNKTIENKYLYKKNIYFSKLLSESNKQKNYKEAAVYVEPHKFIYTALLFFAFLFSFLFLYLIYAKWIFPGLNKLLKLEIDNTDGMFVVNTKRISLILVLSFIGFMGSSYILQKKTPIHFKIVKFKKEISENVKINSKALISFEKKLDYSHKHSLKIGYSSYFLYFKNNNKCLVLEPKSKDFLILNNGVKKDLLISGKNSSKHDLVLAYPKDFNSIKINEKELLGEKIIKNGKGNSICLNISSMQDKNHYLIFFIGIGLGIFLILTLLLNYNPFLSSFLILYLAQGVFLIQTISNYTVKLSHLISRYNLNIAVGILLFFIILTKKYWNIEPYKIIWNLFKKDYVLPSNLSKLKNKFIIRFVFSLLLILTAGLFLFLKYYSIFEILVICGIISLFYYENFIMDKLNENTKRRYLYNLFEENIYLREIIFLIFSISLLIIGQKFAGGELGISIGGVNLQLFELIKIVLIFIITDAIFKEFESKRKKFSLWVWVFPFAALITLAILVHDYSPFIMFSIILFVYIINFVNKYFRDKSIYKICLVVLAVLVLIAMGNKYIDFGKEGGTNATRLYNWQNSFNVKNEQFTSSVAFISAGNNYNLENDAIFKYSHYVPQIKDDFIFSLYFSVYKYFGMFILFLPLIYLIWFGINTMHNSKAYEGKTSNEINNQKKWNSEIIFYLIILFVTQALLPLSNVTAILPIMGQPAPFFSYTASNLILFSFPIFAIIMNLEKENRLIDKKN